MSENQQILSTNGHRKLTDAEKRKNEKGLCITRYCSREHAKQRRYCYRCKHRRHAKSKPISYAFQNLKSNAKRRGKEFSLTLKEFTEFVENSGYMDRKGKTKMAFSVDRIDEGKGYSADNIQVLTISENRKKAHREAMARKYHDLDYDQEAMEYYKGINDEVDVNSLPTIGTDSEFTPIQGESPF